MTFNAIAEQSEAKRLLEAALAEGAALLVGEAVGGVEIEREGGHTPPYAALVDSGHCPS